MNWIVISVALLFFIFFIVSSIYFDRIQSTQDLQDTRLIQNQLRILANLNADRPQEGLSEFTKGG